MRKLGIFLILLLLLSSCGREEVVIKGKVKDPSGNPLEGVRVEIEKLGIYQFTDEEGNFVFKDSFAEKTYILKFEKDGYKTLKKKVDVIKGENSVNVALEFNTLRKVINKGVLVVGMDLNNKPFSFMECSKREGFDVELIEEIGKRMSVSPFIVNIPKDKLLNALREGDIDVAISSIEPTDTDGISFSIPYFIDGYSIIIREREGRIKKAEDLKGRVVEVTDKNFINRVKEMFPGIRRVEYEENLEKAMADLDRVLVDAVISPYSLSAYYCIHYKKIKIVDQLIDGKRYAIAVRSSDQKLLDRINDILLDMFKDGTYDSIFKRWFYPLDSARVIYYNEKRNE